MKYSIEAWIYNPIAKEILLLKVKTEQLSFWQPITGGIENGESSEIACIREIFEETGPVSYTHLTLPTNREV